MMIIMIISDKELSIYRAFSRACARTKMFFCCNCCHVAKVIDIQRVTVWQQYGSNGSKRRFN